VFYFARKSSASDTAHSLEAVIAIAHEAHVPVVVDAAAQSLRREPLALHAAGRRSRGLQRWKRTAGPQASGLILGRRQLIDACALHSSPYQRLARPMKAGKEEMSASWPRLSGTSAWIQAELRARAEKGYFLLGRALQPPDGRIRDQGVPERGWPGLAARPVRFDEPRPVTVRQLGSTSRRRPTYQCPSRRTIEHLPHPETLKPDEEVNRRAAANGDHPERYATGALDRSNAPDGPWALF